MIEHSKNQNVVAASLQQNQYGLLEVVFVCEGAPEYPTALRSGNSSKGEPWTIYDDPLCAFRNGAPAPKYPPQYSYHRANRQIPSWTCKSVLFGDGSAYMANESAREIADGDKRRVFAASLSEWKYGLRVVRFDGVGLIGGKPIFPTALRRDKSLLSNPLEAFWGGDGTEKIPYEISARDEAIGAIWSAKSIVFADGSAYSRVAESESSSKSKMRIFSARVFDAELGLKCVEFRGVGLVSGKPIFPTALAGGSLPTESPRDAYFGGSSTVRLPWSADYSDPDAGVVWTTRVYVNADGSAVSASRANVLREYFDIVNFQFPSVIDLNINNMDGVYELAGAMRKYKAKITEKLVSASALDSALIVPYHIKRWAFYSVGGYNKKTGTAFMDSKSIHGALGGVANALGGTYKGMEVSNTVSVVDSNPSYVDFMTAMKQGQVIECSVRRVFADEDGVDWFVVRTVFLKLSADGLESGDYGEA